MMLVTETADRIKRMEIRGAGRIARAAAESLRDHAQLLAVQDIGAFKADILKAAGLLVATRPTAVSLPNAVHIVLAGLDGAKTVNEARDGVIRQANAFIGSSIHAVGKIAQIGARHIRDGDTILTHCNSEAALACIIEAHRSGCLLYTSPSPRDS